MVNKYIATFLSALALFATIGVTSVFADSNCSTDYGGTTTCHPTNLTINKIVQDPISGEYVENITSAKFSQGNTVNFKLVVANTSGETFHNVKIEDGVPDNLVLDTVDIDYINADGTKKFEISSDKKHVTFTLDEFPAGRTANAFIISHLVGPYPTDDQFCRDNWGTVTATERPDGDKNFARVCVVNKVGEAKTLPVAGVEDLVYVIPFIASGLGGLALMRKK